MQTVIIDQSASSGRGGSIYLERACKYMKERGSSCIMLRRRDGRIRFLLFTLRYIAAGWIHGHEIRGNGPWILVVALVARKTSVYVGSPIHQWSKRSRQLLRITCRLRKIRFLAASKYVRAEILEYVEGSEIYVSYAKIESSSNEESYPVMNDARIVMVVMAPGDNSKGWMRSIAIIKGLVHLNPIVVVYGKNEKEELSLLEGQDIRVRGFREEPFEDLVKKFPGQMHFYIGMSEYEGLHMAVVEAGLRRIPSILSNIPAHKELEDMGQERLLIEDTTDGAIRAIERASADTVKYRKMADRYSRMANRFIGISNRSEFYNS
jgi:hypothetical protein